jgi:hypothetical protein
MHAIEPPPLIQISAGVRANGPAGHEPSRRVFWIASQRELRLLLRSGENRGTFFHDWPCRACWPGKACDFASLENAKTAAHIDKYWCTNVNIDNLQCMRASRSRVPKIADADIRLLRVFWRSSETRDLPLPRMTWASARARSVFRLLSSSTASLCDCASVAEAGSR